MNIETLVQGGAVAIALLLIWRMDRSDKRTQETNKRKDDQVTSIVTNHMNTNTKVTKDLTEAIYKLRETITTVNGKK